MQKDDSSYPRPGIVVIYRLILTFMLITPFLAAQQFSRVEDENNAIVTTSTDVNYSGAAWVDYDNDGDLDLYTTKSFLFRNDGSGVFVSIDTEIGDPQIPHLGNGTSWGDYDNDGDPDCALAATPSMVFRNDGDGQFSGITEGDIGTDNNNTGWTCAWADYNNDSHLDLLIVNPAGFLPSSTPCHLFANNGDGRFTKIEEFEFTTVTDAYTVPTWSDFDDDGDVDLFIGSGHAGTADEDNLYLNLLSETGQADFIRMDIAPIATDLQDGQVWNWIDYDNDGDLDAYVSNYAGAPNRFYRNDDGSYISLDDLPLLVSEASLANTWGDLDNDGDLDCIVTNEGGIPTHYFQNDGEGGFTSITNEITVVGSTRGATLGDYDNDGDLDLFISGLSNGKALFRNDADGSNHWLNITCQGTVSNRSAIGARVMALATIGGESVWQRREIQGQNSFDSQNSLRVHFGLGDATTVDSLIVLWPSGERSELTGISAGQFMILEEAIPAGFLRANFSADILEVIDSDTLTVQFSNLSLSDPNEPIILHEWDFDSDGVIDSNDSDPAWTYTAADTYSVSYTATNNSGSATTIRADYIRVSGFQAVLTVDDGTLDMGNIASDTEEADTTFMLYNVGQVDDSVVVTIDPVNVDPASAISVEPTAFSIAAQDSQEIRVIVRPAGLFENGPAFVPVVLFDSQNGQGSAAHVEKKISFRVVSPTASGSTDSALPSAFELKQNYPNPFNPATVISYALPKAAQVELKIYNILGAEVRTLVSESQVPGYYSVAWDGRDALGQQAASGIYIYRIQAEEYKAARRMFLLQ